MATKPRSDSVIANRPSIRYRPLSSLTQEARFLELKSARRVEDPLSCRLVTLPLTDQLEYVGLSSLHGETSGTEIIYVDGSPVETTTHLGQALRQVRELFLSGSSIDPSITRFLSNGSITSGSDGSELRQSRGAQSPTGSNKKPRWLQNLFQSVGTAVGSDAQNQGSSRRGSSKPLLVWLDAICINPTDAREKEAHTRVLAQIYASAGMVIGWLGPKIPEEGISDAGLEVMGIVEGAMPPTWGEPGDKEAHPEEYSPHHQWMQNIAHIWTMGMDPEHPENFQGPSWGPGTLDFVARPYFHREWILRELTYARFPAFMMGDSIIPWLRVLRVNRFVEELTDKDSNVVPKEALAHVCTMPLGTAFAMLDEYSRQSNRVDIARSLYADRSPR